MNKIWLESLLWLLPNHFKDSFQILTEYSVRILIRILSVSCWKFCPNPGQNFVRILIRIHQESFWNLTRILSGYWSEFSLNIKQDSFRTWPGFPPNPDQDSLQILTRILSESRLGFSPNPDQDPDALRIPTTILIFSESRPGSLFSRNPDLDSLQIFSRIFSES